MNPGSASQFALYCRLPGGVWSFFFWIRDCFEGWLVDWLVGWSLFLGVCQCAVTFCSCLDIHVLVFLVFASYYPEFVVCSTDLFVVLFLCLFVCLFVCWLCSFDNLMCFLCFPCFCHVHMASFRRAMLRKCLQLPCSLCFHLMMTKRKMRLL